jgi:transcriptional regulator with XRE-family HTH domain
MTDDTAPTLTTAKRIKIARVEKGWTQKQLAEAAGISQANLSRYEKGTVAPGGDIVDRIMKAVGQTHTLAAVDGVLGIQGRAAGKLNIVDPSAEPVPVEWIVEGLVARGFLTMLAGEPGAGKSMLTQTIGVGLANGSDIVAGMRIHHGTTSKAVIGYDDDEPLFADASRVLTLDAENGANLIQERAHGMGLDRANVDNYTVAASDGFDIYKDRAVLDGILADYRDAGSPVDMLVIDSWTSMWFGNENVVEQVQLCLKYLNDLAARLNVGILLIHHTDKDGESYRGSSAIAATIGGGVFTFARIDEKEDDDPTARIITCKKMRIAAEPNRLRVYVTGHGISDKPSDVFTR